MKKSIAVSFQENDCIRIIPMSPKHGNAEIKFHFFNDSYIIRKFELNENSGGLICRPVDHGQAEHEISYHGANEFNLNPALLPKYKDDKRRIKISDKIINLDLSDIIVPIPICRFTTSKASGKSYKVKIEHCSIELTDIYNTVDIYIAGKDYNFEEMSHKYPMIVGFLFPMTTIDFLVYGSGMALEPIFNRMFEDQSPVVAIQSEIVGGYQFFFRTYQLMKSDDFRMYSKEEYSNSNFIEFFDNIDYLNLLAITNISYKLTSLKNTPLKSAYKYDLERLERLGVRNKYFFKLKKRFSQSEKSYEKSGKFRSGIIIPM